MRSVKRPTAYEPIVRLLTETNHPAAKKSIFPTMREFLCFAAVLGFDKGVRTPLVGPTTEIDGRVFENSEQAIDLIYLIALADTRNAEMLHPEKDDEMLQIFEEYAVTGLATIEQWLKDRPDDLYGNEALLTAFWNGGYLPREEVARPVDPSNVSF